MHTVTRVRIKCDSDGTEHHSVEHARRHLERGYCSLLAQLTNDINKAGYAGRYQFIHDNLDKFVRLNQIRVDLELTTDDNKPPLDF